MFSRRISSSCSLVVHVVLLQSRNKLSSYLRNLMIYYVSGTLSNYQTETFYVRDTSSTIGPQNCIWFDFRNYLILWLGTFWHCVYSAYIFLVRLRKGAVAMILFRFFYNFERFRFNHVFFLFEVTPNILCTQKKNRISKQFVLRKNQKISRRNSKQNMVKRKITRTKFEILC